MQGAANLCKSIFFPPVKDAYSARMFLCRIVCHMNLVLVFSAPKSLGGGGGVGVGSSRLLHKRGEAVSEKNFFGPSGLSLVQK